MTSDRRHRYGADNRKMVTFGSLALRMDLSTAARDTIVLDGMSAAQVMPSIYGPLVRQVRPGMRHIGCMWLPHGDEALRCNAVVSWTMGVGSPLPRVYCDDHGEKLLHCINQAREANDDYLERAKAGTAIRRVISEGERAEIVTELQAAGKVYLWQLAARHHCHCCTIARIAAEAGIDRKRRGREIREAIRSGGCRTADLMRRFNVSKSCVSRHRKACREEQLRLDQNIAIAEDGPGEASPAGAPTPPGQDAIQEGT